MMNVIGGLQDMDRNNQIFCVACGTAVTVCLALVWKKLTKREVKKIYPRDTAILHHIWRGPYAPSLSPFAVKLETYFRMAKIPYENDPVPKFSSKRKVPWIEYNDQSVADSDICIDFLNKKLGINLNTNLSSAEEGIAQSIQTMMEDHLYWCLVLFRYVYTKDTSFIRTHLQQNKFIMWGIVKDIKKVTLAQGMGRHTQEEVTVMMKKDLQALSDILGTKSFIFGEQPTEVDCTVFGTLSMVYWQMPTTAIGSLVTYEYPSLADYCERMKTRFWPDWDECITHGGTREATK